jgi:hypothetical protein
LKQISYEQISHKLSLFTKNSKICTQLRIFLDAPKSILETEKKKLKTFSSGQINKKIHKKKTKKPQKTDRAG